MLFDREAELPWVSLWCPAFSPREFGAASLTAWSPDLGHRFPLTPTPVEPIVLATKANLAKARDAKERVLVRPTAGWDVGVRDEEADPHKTAALPKVRCIGTCGFSFV